LSCCIRFGRACKKAGSGIVNRRRGNLGVFIIFEDSKMFQIRSKLVRIAVLSDTHDHIANVRAAVDYCNNNGAGMMIHCGDLISPFILKELARFRAEVHLVYGNNVGDLHLVSQHCSQKYPTLTHHGFIGNIEVAGLKIAFHHYPEVAVPLAQQGIYDVVCCGHNHIQMVEKIGKTLLINPGDLLGKDIRPRFCILDTESMEVERVEVGKAMFPTD